MLEGDKQEEMSFHLVVLEEVERLYTVEKKKKKKKKFKPKIYKKYIKQSHYKG